MDLSKNTSIERLTKEKILLVAFLIDKSGSMRGFNQEVPRAWQAYIDLILNSSENQNVLVNPMLFGEGDLTSMGFKLVSDQATLSYYADDGQTDLFDNIVLALNELNESVANYINEGYRARGLLIILSDGGDNKYSRDSTSGRHSFSNACEAIKYTTDNKGQVAFIAFGGGARGVGTDLGITHVMDTDGTVEELYTLFAVASVSTIEMSKSNGVANGTNFFEAAMSGMPGTDNNGNGLPGRLNR